MEARNLRPKTIEKTAFSNQLYQIREQLRNHKNGKYKLPNDQLEFSQSVLRKYAADTSTKFVAIVSMYILIIFPYYYCGN